MYMCACAIVCTNIGRFVLIKEKCPQDESVIRASLCSSSAFRCDRLFSFWQLCGSCSIVLHSRVYSRFKEELAEWFTKPIGVEDFIRVDACCSHLFIMRLVLFLLVSELLILNDHRLIYYLRFIIGSLCSHSLHDALIFRFNTCSFVITSLAEALCVILQLFMVAIRHIFLATLSMVAVIAHSFRIVICILVWAITDNSWGSRFSLFLGCFTSFVAIIEVLLI